MEFLIDTSIIIEHERGRLDLNAKVREADGDFYLSVISASELLHGAHRTKDRGLRARRTAFAEAILERFPILPIDSAVARVHSRIWAELAGAGQPIGAHDMWIAAQAVAHGLCVVTGNVREFGRVAGLIVQNWGS